MAISDKVKRKLLAASGGFCGNPNCHRNLFDFFETGEVKNIEELAHIIGQKEAARLYQSGKFLTQVIFSKIVLYVTC